MQNCCNEVLQQFCKSSIERLAEYNFDRERLLAGRALCDAAIAAQSLQKVEAGEGEDATAARDAAWDVAEKSYTRLLKIARMALASVPTSAQALGMDGQRKKSLTGWMAQARQFYDGLAKHPEYLARLGSFGITAAKVAAARADLDALDAASSTQHTEQVEAQDATAKRDAALDAADTWMEEFVVVFKVALEDSPQLIETLGVVVA